jgi:uncharacterized protein (DUF1778 family)
MVRPKLPDAERRSEVYQVRLTVAEKELIVEAAEKLAVPVSEMLRDAVLSKAKRALKAES